MAGLISHPELIKYAQLWLKKPYKNTQPFGHSACKVIIPEMVTAAYQIPDVVAWTAYGKCIMIECKTSRSDYRADGKKRLVMHPGFGVGETRYYCVPDGLISPEECREGYGLLYVKNKRIKCVKDSSVFKDHSHRDEFSILVSYIRRLTEYEDFESTELRFPLGMRRESPLLKRSW